jgi:hypothetical protein
MTDKIIVKLRGDSPDDGREWDAAVGSRAVENWG